MKLAAAIVAAAVLATAAGASPPDPKPLAGAPLGRTGLRLLVAATTPFVLDVDTGRVARVGDIPALTPLLWIAGVGRGAVVVQGAGEARLYGVRGDGAVARLGRGGNAWPAADGGSAWVQSGPTGGRCTLRRVDLGGRVLRGPRPFPCATVSDPAGGAFGIVVGRTRVVDPDSGRTVRRTRRGILTVAGRTLVLAGPGRDLTLLDARGTERRVARPDTLHGGPAALAAPGSRFVLLDFEDPAWQLTGTQVVDLWLLDTHTAAMTRLPGMPLDLLLKRTSASWTADGRVVVLGEDRRGGFVAVWRPGRRTLEVKRVRLPERAGGSDSFAVLG